ncbi:hypothetical protein TNCT_523531 [Trichonephila clavata]|uniref:Uncharacterized protein n=1 Tax=Trichonephila clavata TaxID=2740835 RepID=A0A8X6G4W0_TRICU|nr:hypothetical protein TNCT_523531 [Trichonephila clavata]
MHRKQTEIIQPGMEFDECPAYLPLNPPSHTHNARQHPRSSFQFRKVNNPISVVDSVSAAFRWRGLTEVRFGIRQEVARVNRRSDRHLFQRQLIGSRTVVFVGGLNDHLFH